MSSNQGQNPNPDMWQILQHIYTFENPQRYKKGYQVLWLKTTPRKRKGKFHTKWMGPYEIDFVYPNGTMDLLEMKDTWTRVNANKIKPYY